LAWYDGSMITPQTKAQRKPKRKTVAQRIKENVDKVHAAYGETWEEVERLKKQLAGEQLRNEKLVEFISDLGNGKLDNLKTYTAGSLVGYVDFDKVNAIVRKQIKTGNLCWRAV
jgi:predicted patatin/cPLA2 family phospholipase